MADVLALPLDLFPKSSYSVFMYDNKVPENTFFSWTIKNFSILGPNVEKTTWKAEFPTKKSMFQWKLEIQPRDLSSDAKQYVSCHLHIISAPNIDVRTQVCIYFLDSNGVSVHELSGAAKLAPGFSLSWEKFINYSYLLKMLNDNILTVEVRITYSIFHSISAGQLCNQDSINLSRDFLRILNDPKHGDITICVENTEMKAHRAILSARSSVFAAMFDHDTLEKENSRVDIHDFDANTISSLLYFMYTGIFRIKSGVNSAMCVLQAADKYDMQNLKSYCMECLYSHMDESNVFDVLVRADLNGYPQLKEWALAIFQRKRKPFDFEKHKSVLQENPSLMFEIMKKLAV